MFINIGNKAKTMSRNNQYIISDNIKSLSNDIERELSFWNLQFLRKGELSGIDYTIDENTSDNLFTPTDLAIKSYVNSSISKLSIQRQDDGEKENYYGVYSGGYDSDGMNNFIRVLPERYSVATDLANPLILKIDKTKYTIYNVSTITNSTYIPKNHRVTITCDHSGDELSRYISEVSYTNITDDDTSVMFYIMEIPSESGTELSTVRVDREHKKLYFEHMGSISRGNWRITSGLITKNNIITNGTYSLYEIGYVYIEKSGDNFIPHMFYTPPQMIYDSSELIMSPKDNSLGYNVIEDTWYRYNNITSSVEPYSCQLIGMIGVMNVNDLPEYVCSFAFPNYLEKNQKNTIKLKVEGNSIVSVHGDNIVYLASNVAKSKNYKYKWEIDTNSYRGKTVFLFIDKDGIERIDTNRPYRNPFGGYYLNNKNWRCVGSVFVQNSGTLSTPWDFNGTVGDIEQYQTNGYAQVPLGFDGIIRVSGSNINEYSSDEYDVVPVSAGSSVEYIGVING